MLKELFKNSPIKSITGAAAIVALSSFVSRILGLFRDRVLAGEFGAGEMLDIYYAAFRLPDFMYSLLILGGLSAAFIPVFTGFLRKDTSNKDAFEFANTVISVGLVVIVPLIAMGVLFAPYIINMFVAPGFTPEQQTLTTSLTRIMFLSPLLLGISGVASYILQSFKRFFLYSLAPIFYNVGIIIGALYFTDFLGLHGLSWGVVLGAALHLLIQLPGLRGINFKFSFIPDFKHKQLKTFATLAVPRTFNLLVIQLNLVVITFIASYLTPGSITVFNLANNIQGVPIGIIGISFAVAAFPALSEYANFKEKKHFSNSLSKTVNEILFFVLPLTILIIALRAQIVRVILGTGAFNWEDTIITFNTLGFFSISLFAQSLIPLLLRAFYALKNTYIPLIISIFAFVLNIALSFLFSIHYTLGVPGLALAFSIANIFQLIGLWVALRIQFGYLNDLNVLKSGIRILFATVSMLPFIIYMKIFVASAIGTDTFITVLLQGVVTGFVAIVVYILVSWLIRSEELSVFVNAIKRRLFKPKAPIDVGAGREM